MEGGFDMKKIVFLLLVATVIQAQETYSREDMRQMVIGIEQGVLNSREVNAITKHEVHQIIGIGWAYMLGTADELGWADNLNQTQAVTLLRGLIQYTEKVVVNYTKYGEQGAITIMLAQFLPSKWPTIRQYYEDWLKVEP
jgi:hypothetical protein